MSMNKMTAAVTAALEKLGYRRIRELQMMCCCALCDILAATADTGGMLKQSESVGSWSYTLASGSSTSAAGLMFSKCQTWLPADWLYRGVARE